MAERTYPAPAEMIEVCNAAVVEQIETGDETLNSWEIKFASSLEVSLRTYGSLSAKQLAKLKQIYDKVSGRPELMDEDYDTRMGRGYYDKGGR